MSNGDRVLQEPGALGPEHFLLTDCCGSQVDSGAVVEIVDESTVGGSVQLQPGSSAVADAAPPSGCAGGPCSGTPVARKSIHGIHDGVHAVTSATETDTATGTGAATVTGGTGTGSGTADEPGTSSGAHTAAATYPQTGATAGSLPTSAAPQGSGVCVPDPDVQSRVLLPFQIPSLESNSSSSSSSSSASSPSDGEGGVRVREVGPEEHREAQAPAAPATSPAVESPSVPVLSRAMENRDRFLGLRGVCPRGGQPQPPASRGLGLHSSHVRLHSGAIRHATGTGSHAHGGTGMQGAAEAYSSSFNYEPKYFQRNRDAYRCETLAAIGIVSY